jgi:SSS family solute:Na+ symporter
MGYLNKRAPAIAAKISLIFFIGMYGILNYFVKLPLHYLHISAILFIICCVFMYIYGRLSPRSVPFELKTLKVVNMRPWKYRYEFSTILIALMVSVYILLSKIGLAREGGADGKTALWMLVAIGITAFLGVAAKKLLIPWEKRFYGIEDGEADHEAYSTEVV